MESFMNIGLRAGPWLAAASTQRLGLCVGLCVLASAFFAPRSSALASTETILYTFCSAANCVDGENPEGGLVQDGKGVFYGTTTTGGTYGQGTIYALIPAKNGGYNHKVLYSFCPGSLGYCPDGANPRGTLVIDAAGNLFGTTDIGGAGAYGEVFELSRDVSRRKWKLRVIHSFCWDCGEGNSPFAGLSYAGQQDGIPYDGTSPLYGTTEDAGPYNGGTVYEMTPRKGRWKETTIYGFCQLSNCADGATPFGRILVASSGVLYGTASAGGATGNGVVFSLSGSRKAWKAWNENVVYNFCSLAKCADGGRPTTSLVADANGNLFGTAGIDGPNCNDEYCGVTFEISPNGSETVLHAFGYENLPGDLVIDSGGNIFGGTFEGGANNSGVVYELNQSYTVMYNFCGESNCADGNASEGALFLDGAGNVYGVTFFGGTGPGNGGGVVFKLSD